MSDALSPQLTFPGAHSWAGLTHIAAAVVAIGLVLWLFRTERRVVSSRVGWSLLGLRLTAIAVVLCILWQPTWAWVVDQTRLGRIAVAIDVSDSMQTIDLQATTSERRDWLSAIGWMNRSESLEVSPADDANAAASVSVAERPPDGLDAESWRDLTSRLAGLSRWEIARRTVTTGPDSLWSQLEPLGTPELFFFGGNAVAATITDLDAEDLSIPAATTPALTQLNAPLQAAQRSDASTPLLGLILLTDGRETSASNALELARVAGQNNIPIFPVLVGSTHRPKDLSLLSVEAPLAVYRDDHPRVKVLVSTPGFSGQTVDVTLDLVEPDGRFSPLTKTVIATEASQTLEFDLPAEELGERRYVVSIPAQPDETTTDNNRKEFSLQVVDDRTRVLLLDGPPRWEFRYLEIAYARDERVDSRVVLFDQPSLGLLPEPYFPRSWPTVDPQSGHAAFADQDLIILGDVSAADLPEGRWLDLQKFVAEQGGLLVLVAGRESLPLQHDSPTLRKLLPITAPRLQTAGIRPGSEITARGWNWSLSPEGAMQTALQFASDGDTNRAIWNMLPGATWAIVGEPKPAATVWVWGRNEAAGPAVPLMVQQNYGLGQVIWIATDSTWRWRFRSADLFHHRFWGQLARYASATKLAAGNEFVQFGPLKRNYGLDEPVEVQARWSAQFLAQPAAQRQGLVEVYAGANKVQELALVVDPQRPLLSLGTLSSLPAGDYRLRLVAPQANLGPDPLDAPVTISQPPTVELAELAPNRTFLQELAEASGGKLFLPGEAWQIPQHLPAFEMVTSLPQQQPLWDRWPTYFILAALLTAEWIIRRSSGLP